MKEKLIKMTSELVKNDSQYASDERKTNAGAAEAQFGRRSSPVASFFSGSSIFITGASGFIGRVLLEKLLRTYQDINKVYILLRPKRNQQPYERLHKNLLRVPIFDNIRSMKNGEELLDKIVVISGDIGEENLGISNEDRERLFNDPSLSIVFHSAASVKFEEPLRNSIKFNLRATKTVIEMCRQIKNLKCFCHVSTAYVNSDQRDGQWISEKLYPISVNPEDILKLADLLDDKMMQEVKGSLVGGRPNTYTYTKALAEHLIAQEASDLPVVIVRPSIVVAAWKEPLRGWIDNLNGPTGLILAIGKGLLRSMYAKRDCKADIIPVDVVANTIIAATYYAAKEYAEKNSVATSELLSVNDDQKKTTESTMGKVEAVRAGKIDGNHHSGLNSNDNNNNDRVAKIKREPPIFHCTSGDINPITWGAMEDTFWPIILKYPSQQVLRYPYGTFKANKYHDMLTRLFVHLLPALIVDLLCLVTGKKRQLLSIYDKLHKATKVLTNFCTTNYNFQSDKFRELSSYLTDPTDRAQLYMDISSLDWCEFWDYYILGAR